MQAFTWCRALCAHDSYTNSYAAHAYAYTRTSHTHFTVTTRTYDHVDSHPHGRCLQEQVLTNYRQGCLWLRQHLLCHCRHTLPLRPRRQFVAFAEHCVWLHACFVLYFARVPSDSPHCFTADVCEPLAHALRFCLLPVVVGPHGTFLTFARCVVLPQRRAVEPYRGLLQWIGAVP